MSEHNALKSRERKEYSSSFHTCAEVWAILWECATPEQPLSAQAVWSCLKLRNHTPDRLPSPSTIGKLLRSACCGSSDSFLFQLRCVALVDHRLIPYEQWEEQLEETARRTGAVQSRSNRPRLYYLEKPLTQGEWRLFSDLVQSAPCLSASQSGKLLDALRCLNPRQQVLQLNREPVGGSRDFLTVLDRLDRAIRERRCVDLVYGSWQLEQTEERWKPRLRPLPAGRTHGLRPYAMVWSGGCYYLLAGNQGRPLFLRADRILAAQLREETFTLPPEMDLTALCAGDCLFSGTAVPVRLRCPLSLVGTVMDCFGSRPVYSTPADGRTEFTLLAVPEAVKRFALTHCDCVEVLQPESLRRELRESLYGAYRRYQP